MNAQQILAAKQPWHNPLQTLVSSSVVIAFCLVSGAVCHAQDPDRPNILWITSEDNAAHWLGCYGNDAAQTPRIDELASQSILFRYAYSNAPVCAVARSTILTGCYATTLGTQHMRSRYPIPERIQPHVSFLRAAGYYCTNRSKTDYNIRGNDKSIWDECSQKAHYKNRPADKPFFSIVNITVSHESSLFPSRVQRNRKNGVIPEKTRLDPAAIDLPDYLPDLSEVRRDIAIYHDTLTALDGRIGAILDELEQQGLSDDTIVFYYSDHGGPNPRSKRYLENTGVRVPMMVRVPEKWKSLCPFSMGETTEELVSFVDLSPTLLSLCGIDCPDHMQGRPFLGNQRIEPAEDAMVYLFADRFDEINGMRRGITDGRYKYIRRFTPHLPAAPYSYYSLSVPSWKAWQEAWEAGSLPPQFAGLWESPQPVEQLFDTDQDPWEVKNLANDPAHRDRLIRMRLRLRAAMAENRDTGVIPEGLFDFATKPTGWIGDFMEADPALITDLVDLAFLAGDSASDNLPQLNEAMNSDHLVKQYWGLLGFQIGGEAGLTVPDRVHQLSRSHHPAIRIAALQALHAAGVTEAKSRILAEFSKREPMNDGAVIQLFNAVLQLNAESEVPETWIAQMLEDKNTNQYAKRYAQRLRELRDAE